MYSDVLAETNFSQYTCTLATVLKIFAKKDLFPHEHFMLLDDRLFVLILYVPFNICSVMSGRVLMG